MSNTPPGSPTGSPSEPVVPINAVLSPDFYTNKFNISRLHVVPNHDLMTGESTANIPTPITPSAATVLSPAVQPLQSSTSSSSLGPIPLSASEIEAQDDMTPVISIFDDLHNDHNINTNDDLMYEVLYQLHCYVPGWNIIPFELFVTMLRITPLTGGYTNLLHQIELLPIYTGTLPNAIQSQHSTLSIDDMIALVTSTRPKTLTKFIKDVRREIRQDNTTNVATTTTEDNNSNNTHNIESTALESLYQQADPNTPTPDSANPSLVDWNTAFKSVSCVAVRIYGTNEFTNRTCELALANAASVAQLSEHIYCSWRHGRITSYLDGASVGLPGWIHPLISLNSAYLQGKLQVTDFPNAMAPFINQNVSMPPLDKPSLHHTLLGWFDKACNTTLYKQLRSIRKEIKNAATSEDAQSIRTLHGLPSSTVFETFTDKDNILCTFHRPPNAHPTTDTRISNIVVPVHPDAMSFILPLMNAYQIILPEDTYKQHLNDDNTVTTVATVAATATDSTTTIPFTVDTNVLLAIKQSLTSSSIYNARTHSSIAQYRYSQVEKRNPLAMLHWINMPQIKQEILWLLSQCTHFNIATCHNDFHGGNVMLLNKLMQSEAPQFPSHHDDNITVNHNNNSNNTTPLSTPVNTTPDSITLPSLPCPLPSVLTPYLKVIDFEYGGYNYASYDIVNSLNETWIDYIGEMPGFTLDMPTVATTFLIGDVSTYNTADYNIDVLSDKYNQQNTTTTAQILPYSEIDARFTDATNTGYDHVSSSINEYETPLSSQRVQDTFKGWCVNDSNSELDTAIQTILLGQHHTKEVLKPLSQHNKPRFHAREVTWIHAFLVGYYHALYTPQNINIMKENGIKIPTITEYIDKETPRILYECLVLQLAVQLLWAVWGVILTETSQIEGFGYLEHAVSRLFAYVARKEVCLKLGLFRP